MKQLLIYLMTAFAGATLFAQVPDGFSYQAVLRDNQGAVMANQSVSLRLSILDGGSIQMYQEEHATTTSEFGLITLVVGQGSPTTGTFEAIDWQIGTYFMEVELDETGGSNFASLGSFQLLTVPFAMYANKAMDVNDADADSVNELQMLSKSGDTVSLSNGGGFFIDEVVDADADSLNEIQMLSLSDDTLRLSGGGDISLAPYMSKWEATPSGINYHEGHVGINEAAPAERFVVKDTVTNGPLASVLVHGHVNPNTVTDWVWGQVALLGGEVSPSTTELAFRAIQGYSAVNNPGGNTNYSQGLVGFADSAYYNHGVVGRAGFLGDPTPGLNRGVWGLAQSSTGNNRGIEGWTQGSATFESGVYGLSTGDGANNYGVQGRTTATGTGFNVGVRGSAVGTSQSNTNYGIYGSASNGGTNFAGYFDGNVQINGSLSKSGGTFKIDHPLDPANQYLIHSFVESPDMLNVYNGNIRTDGNGIATVKLPSYFESANKDFKYQLTVIGVFAQAIISKKLSNNQFVIQTDQPHVEVSWQITGVRNDPWANANRVQPEVEKTGKETGKYLHPELYGQPKTMGMPQPENDPAPQTLPPSSKYPSLNQRNK